MRDDTKAEFLEAFTEATTPFQKALDDHAKTAAAHNAKQDETMRLQGETLSQQSKVLTDLVVQHAGVRETQAGFAVSVKDIKDTLRQISRDMNANNNATTMVLGELTGNVKNLTRQSATQFERLDGLDARMNVGDGEKAAAISPLLPPLPVPDMGLLKYMNENKLVVMSVIGIIIIITYGAFAMYGIDVRNAKDLIPTAAVAKRDNPMEGAQ